MRLIDLTGIEFGKLIVLRRAPNKYGKPAWLTKCQCGNETVISGASLRNGKSKTCGCSKIKRLQTHGLSRTRLYQCWKDMVQRCTNKKCKNYKYYGGRGIKLYEPWLRFEPFKNWALENGYSDNLELDRRRNERGYFPKNCRWVTHAVNMQNTRRSHA